MIIFSYGDEYVIERSTAKKPRKKVLCTTPHVKSPYRCCYICLSDEEPSLIFAWHYEVFFKFMAYPWRVYQPGSNPEAEDRIRQIAEEYRFEL